MLHIVLGRYRSCWTASIRWQHQLISQCLSIDMIQSMPFLHSTWINLGIIRNWGSNSFRQIDLKGIQKISSILLVTYPSNMQLIVQLWLANVCGKSLLLKVNSEKCFDLINLWSDIFHLKFVINYDKAGEFTLKW